MGHRKLSRTWVSIVESESRWPPILERPFSGRQPME